MRERGVVSERERWAERKHRREEKVTREETE